MRRETKRRVEVMHLDLLDRMSLEVMNDDLYDDDGYLRVMDARDWQRIPDVLLRAWCNMNAVYQCPTTELIEWLRQGITGSAIEIGAGHGSIARALGIPATDSYIQCDPNVIGAEVIAAGVAASRPAFDVERLDALEAIAKYKPDTVIGSWITHKWEPGMQFGFVHGVDEWEVLRKVKRYIVIGNDDSHGSKPIAKGVTHSVIRRPWLVSRAIVQQRNAIYVWNVCR